MYSPTPRTGKSAHMLMSTEARQLACKRFGLGPSAPCLYNTCGNRPSACIAEMLLQDEQPEQGAHSFPVITACLFGGSGENDYFSKENLVITILRIYAQSSSVLNSITLPSHEAQQRHMPALGQEGRRWTGNNSAEDSSTFPGKDK